MPDVDRLWTLAGIIRDEMVQNMLDLGLEVPERRAVVWGEPVLDDPCLLVALVETLTSEGEHRRAESSIVSHGAHGMRTATFGVTVCWPDPSLGETNPISQMGPSTTVLEQVAAKGLRFAWGLTQAALTASKAGKFGTERATIIGDVFNVETEGALGALTLHLHIQPGMVAA